MKTFDQWYHEKYPLLNSDQHKADLRAAWEEAMKAFAEYLLKPFMNPDTKGS